MRDCGRHPSIIVENKAITDVKPINLKNAPMKKPSGKKANRKGFRPERAAGKTGIKNRKMMHKS